MNIMGTVSTMKVVSSSVSAVFPVFPAKKRTNREFPLVRDVVLCFSVPLVQLEEDRDHLSEAFGHHAGFDTGFAFAFAH